MNLTFGPLPPLLLASPHLNQFLTSPVRTHPQHPPNDLSLTRPPIFEPTDHTLAILMAPPPSVSLSLPRRVLAPSFQQPKIPKQRIHPPTRPDSRCVCYLQQLNIGDIAPGCHYITSLMLPSLFLSYLPFKTQTQQPVFYPSTHLVRLLHTNSHSGSSRLLNLKARSHPTYPPSISLPRLCNIPFPLHS